MTEAQYQREIQEALEKIGAKAIKIHGNHFTEKGTPDIIGCYKGCMFAIETKVGNNKPTQIQMERMKEWQSAGALVFVACYPTHLPFEVANYIVSQIEKAINAYTYSD